LNRPKIYFNLSTNLNTVEHIDNSINTYAFDHQVNMIIVLLSKSVRFHNIKLLIDKKLMKTRENKIYIYVHTHII